MLTETFSFGEAQTIIGSVFTYQIVTANGPVAYIEGVWAGSKEGSALVSLCKHILGPDKIDSVCMGVGRLPAEQPSFTKVKHGYLPPE